MIQRFLFTSLVCLLFCSATFGQNNSKSDKKEPVKDDLGYRNVFTVAVGLHNKFRVKYERVVAEPVSLTLTASGYYGFFPGVLGAAGVRFYLSDPAPKGFYLSPRVHVGYFNLSNWKTDGRTYDFTQNNFTAVGGGFQAGYQFMVGKRDNICIDLAIGAKYLPMPKGINFLTVNGVQDQYYSDDLDWMRWFWKVTGPGSFLDATIAFGFAF